MNPDTNEFEDLKHYEELLKKEIKNYGNEIVLYRPNGEPVPDHWSVFVVGETYTINNYTFKCAYVGKTSILFEPVGPVLIGADTQESEE